MTSVSQLEELYQPSLWSKRFSSPEEVLSHHLKFIEDASRKVRREIPCHLNLPYGPSDRQKVDIFGTDLPDDSPLFVFIHGGYWQEAGIRRDSYHFIAKNLHRAGAKTAFVGYDLCPQVTLPQIVRQIELASTKCLEYSKSCKGVFFSGHSAGAHLAASLFAKGMEGAAVKGALLISGVFDLLPLLKTTVNEPLRMDEKVAAEMSPMKQRTTGNGTVDFRLVVGENESPEFVKQSKEYCEKLKESGFEARFSVVEDVDHYDIVEMLADEDFQLTKWIVDMIASN